MNILNLANVLGDDVPLSALSLCDEILERLYETTPNLALLIRKEDTGTVLMGIFESLDDVSQNKLAETALVNVLKTQIVIHDVTLYRADTSNKSAKCELWPKRIIGLFITFMFSVVLYKLAVFIFLLKSEGEVVDGIVYKVMLFLLSILKPLLF